MRPVSTQASTGKLAQWNRSDRLELIVQSFLPPPGEEEKGKKVIFFMIVHTVVKVKREGEEMGKGTRGGEKEEWADLSPRARVCR